MTALLAVLVAAAAVALVHSALRSRELAARLALASAEADRARDDLAAAGERRARLEAEAASAGEKIALLRADREQLAARFAQLSKEALDANSAHVVRLAEQIAARQSSELEKREQAMAALVRPVAESLRQVDGKIRELENARVGAYASLRQQLGALAETQTALRSETGKLTNALRAPAVRGRWGELQLRRVVELAGMLEHCDFDEQRTVQGPDGIFRPDLVVKLPGGKTLVVDAKVPLAAYMDALDAPDEAARKAHLSSHARQLKQHVAQLARKAYWDQFAHSPEFVILYVPNEAVLAAAMEADPSLMEGAISERVLLASPTTLISSLRGVAMGWRQESLARDAQEIAALGRELHKRLGTMVVHFAKVGRTLQSAVGAYNETVGSFERMVVPGARKLREKAAPMDGEVDALPDVDAAPRALQPGEPELLPDDAN